MWCENRTYFIQWIVMVQWMCTRFWFALQVSHRKVLKVAALLPYYTVNAPNKKPSVKKSVHTLRCEWLARKDTQTQAYRENQLKITNVKKNNVEAKTKIHERIYSLKDFLNVMFFLQSLSPSKFSNSLQWKHIFILYRPIHPMWTFYVSFGVALKIRFVCIVKLIHRFCNEKRNNKCETNEKFIRTHFENRKKKHSSLLFMLLSANLFGPYVRHEKNKHTHRILVLMHGDANALEEETLASILFM